MNEHGKRIEWRFDCDKLMAHVRIYGKMAYDKEASLRELAALFDVSASTFSRLDMNAQPDLGVLCKICSVLDTDPGNFFTRTVWVVES